MFIVMHHTDVMKVDSIEDDKALVTMPDGSQSQVIASTVYESKEDAIRAAIHESTNALDAVINERERLIFAQIKLACQLFN